MVGERAELIAHYRSLEQHGVLASIRATAKATSDMLEADGKPKNFLRLRGQLEQEWSEVRALKEASKTAQQVAVPAKMTFPEIVEAAGAQHIDVYAASFMCGIRAAEKHYGIGKKP